MVSLGTTVVIMIMINNNDDDDDDDKTIIPSVIFYSLHRCLQILDQDHSYCKNNNFGAVRHERNMKMYHRAEN